jgi:cytochrome c oxidase accessory protein FixG
VTAPPIASGRVLPTLNEDGTRNWIRPRPSPGRWWRRRQVVAYVLMVVFIALPHIQVGGHPAFLMSFPKREFHLMGWTFLPTDTLLFMLFLFSTIIGIFLLTALFGRAWCGWACPQTVYLEFLFRPIERLFEGGYAGSRALDRERKWFTPARLAKYGVYALISLVLAHTFLAYFVGVEQLSVWMRSSPWEHPTGFFVMALTAVGVWYNFTYFREQTCLIACPYGRWQSVLLDKQSIIVAYDYLRGEPRGKAAAANRPETMGDCIDCKACVTTCPTGIDIRNGLQMECVHCTQCIDACDAIMDKVGKPRGLIRYSSQEALAGKPRKLVRLRTVLYPLAFTAALTTLLVLLFTKENAEVTVLRGLGAPFTEDASGVVTNQVRVKITNRADSDRTYRIDIAGVDGGRVVAPENPLPVSRGTIRETSVFVQLPRDAFTNGVRDVTVTVTDGARFTTTVPWRLQGPSNGTASPPAMAPGGTR